MNDNTNPAATSGDAPDLQSEVRLLVRDIMANLEDRRGVLEDIDDDVMEEIRESLAINVTDSALFARIERAAAPTPTYWNAQRKIIERAIIGLRDGWASRKDADAALQARAASPATASGDELTTVECPTCNGHGLIGGHSGQTPESYEEHTQGCDDCDGQGRVIVSRADLAAVSAATKPAADLPRPSDDELWDATLRDRDTYHEWADKLAEAISKHFDAYIGEHSNANCPWAEALEAIEFYEDERPAHFAALLPGPYYMDPPDGGSVSILEQFKRMAEDAARWRSLLATKPAGAQPKPIGTVIDHDRFAGESTIDVYLDLGEDVYGAPTAAPADQVRNQALEEAAKDAEDAICSCCWSEDAQTAAETIAERIRALKSSATQTTEGAGNV